MCQIDVFRKKAGEEEMGVEKLGDKMGIDEMGATVKVSRPPYSEGHTETRPRIPVSAKRSGKFTK